MKPNAQIIVHPRAFSGPGSVMRLLQLAIRLNRELVSSRRGHILLASRADAIRHHTERHP